MSDNSISRTVGREVFGLIVRLLSLWLLGVSGIMFFTLLGPLSNGPMMLASFLGLCVGIWLFFRADFVCRLTYGRTEPDRSIR
jgi:hypothetical protein